MTESAQWGQFSEHGYTNLSLSIFPYCRLCITQKGYKVYYKDFFFKSKNTKKVIFCPTPTKAAVNSFKTMHTLQACTVQYSTCLQCTVQHSTEYACSVQYSTCLQCSVQHSTEYTCSVGLHCCIMYSTSSVYHKNV